MNRLLIYLTIFLFSVIAQGADVAERQLIFIDGGSNFGKSTTAVALKEHFNGKKVGMSSIDFHWTLRTWGGMLADAEKFIAENDTWDDLETKLNQDQSGKLIVREKLAYAKDFFTRVCKATPWQALQRKNYDVAHNFLEDIRFHCCMSKDIIIVDIYLELLLQIMRQREDWDCFINDLHAYTLTQVILVSDYPSYLKRYEHRNTSEILSDHRSNKLSEAGFNTSLEKVLTHHKNDDNIVNKIIIDITGKSAVDVANEIFSHVL